MPPAKRRRLTPPAADETTEATTTSPTPQTDSVPDESPRNPPEPHIPDESPSTTQAGSTTNPSAPTNANDRHARFAALKARATASSRSNLAEAKAEANRSAHNPQLLATLSRKSAVAQHNLLKADTEESGGQGAFERKRAWDYTIEESERWDERTQRKKEARDNNVFQDYGAEAGKIYDRQIREMGWRGERDGGTGSHNGAGETAAKGMRNEYDRLKTELIENAARSGGLEVVEMENGELVAIDNDGTFYSSTDSTNFVEQKPRKENVDRLVSDIRKAEEVRLRKRRERGRANDEDAGDVTYINDKNKQFNLKLARFYDRYTGDIRESFERGTAI